MTKNDLNRARKLLIEQRYTTTLCTNRVRIPSVDVEFNRLTITISFRWLRWQIVVTKHIQLVQFIMLLLLCNRKIFIYYVLFKNLSLSFYAFQSVNRPGTVFFFRYLSRQQASLSENTLRIRSFRSMLFHRDLYFFPKVFFNTSLFVTLSVQVIEKTIRNAGNNARPVSLYSFLYSFFFFLFFAILCTFRIRIMEHNAL